MIETAYEKGMKIYLNPSPFNHHLKDCDLTKIDTFLINEIEGFQITNKKDPKELLKEMIYKYPTSSTVLTLGEQGAYFSNNDIQIQ